MITVVLVVIAVLAYLGNSLGQLASVFGMAVALWLTDTKPLARRLGALTIGSLTCTLAGEVIHVAYHAREAAAGRSDPAHGGFWMSAVLVGLINAAVVASVVWLGDWYRDRKLRARVARLQSPPHGEKPIP